MNLLKLLLCQAGFLTAASSSQIDFTQIPSCARNSCFPYHSSAIGCPQLTKDCFCAALAPINCAGQSCNGSDWYALEDWFDTQCNPPPIVDFLPLPQCSRACTRNSIIPKFCQTQITRNCFCRLQVEVESFSPCVQNGCNVSVSAVNITRKFYRDTCIYQPIVDGSGQPDPSINQQGEVVSSPGGGGDNASALSEKIGLASGVSALLLIPIGFVIWFYRHSGWFRCLGNFFDPPPRYEV